MQKYLVIAAGLLAVMLALVYGRPSPVTAQGANYRFSVAAYGGAISTSPAYASLSDCNTAHAALNQGYPMTACIYTSGQ